MRITQYYPTRFAPSLGYSRSPWAGLESEIDRLFESTLSSFAGATGGNPFPVDLYEDNDNTYVRAELPGVSRSDINVELVEGNLTIAATRKQKQGEQEETFSFSRSISLPEEAQADKVSAAFENGILTVTLPKHEKAKPRKVPVKVQ